MRDLLLLSFSIAACYSLKNEINTTIPIQQSMRQPPDDQNTSETQTTHNQNILRTAPATSASELANLDRDSKDSITESGEPDDFFDSPVPILTTPSTDGSEFPYHLLPTMSLTTLATWDVGTNVWQTLKTPSRSLFSYTVKWTIRTTIYKTTHPYEVVTNITLIDRNTPDLYSLFTRTPTPTTTTTTTKKPTKFTTTMREPIVYHIPHSGDDEIPEPEDTSEAAIRRSVNPDLTPQFRKIFYRKGALAFHRKHASHRLNYTNHTHRSARDITTQLKHTNSLQYHTNQTPEISTKRNVSALPKTTISSTYQNITPKPRNMVNTTYADEEKFLRKNLRDLLMRYKEPHKQTSTSHESHDYEQILKKRLYKAQRIQ